MALRIVADSGADLPKDVIEKYNIEVLPMQVTVDGVSYIDGETMEPKRLMDMMRAGSTTKTSLPAAERIQACFERLLSEGHEVLCISFSSALSGTYNLAAMLAQQIKEGQPDARITVIDSKCASVGLGLVIYYAAMYSEQGMDSAALIEKVHWMCDNMEHIFTVDDLEYLLRGGRVSKTAAFVGGLLGIKPILHVDDDGRLIPLEKVRGRRRSIRRIVEIAGERGVNLPEQIIGICHGDDPAAAEELKALLTEAYGCSRFFINNIGCAIGAHSGPGTLSVFFLSA